MIDANQVWDAPQSIEYVKRLTEIKPWIIEEPSLRAPTAALSAIATCPHPIGQITDLSPDPCQRRQFVREC